MTYEIWVLGYNEDDSVNDYEYLVCGNIEKRTWAYQLFNYVESLIEKPQETPKAKLVLEAVVDNNCVDVLAETELED